MTNSGRSALRSMVTMAVLLVLCLQSTMWVWRAGAAEVADDGRTLVLGVRTDAPPFSYCADGVAGKNCEGYTFDLCRRIAEKALAEGLYCDIDYKEVSAADRFDLLEKKEIDMLCGASTVTLERMRVAHFTFFTFLSGASVMYRSPAKEQTSEDDFTFRLGVLGGTTSEEQAKKILKNFKEIQNIFPAGALARIETLNVGDHNSGLQKILDGEIDAYLADREILLALRKLAIHQGASVDLTVLDDYFTVEQYAIGLQLEAIELRFIANLILSSMYDYENYAGDEGHIYNLLQKHFPGKRFSKSLTNLFRLQQVRAGRRVTGFLQRVECEQN